MILKQTRRCKLRIASDLCPYSLAPGCNTARFAWIPVDFGQRRPAPLIVCRLTVGSCERASTPFVGVRPQTWEPISYRPYHFLGDDMLRDGLVRAHNTGDSFAQVRGSLRWQVWPHKLVTTRDGKTGKSSYAHVSHSKAEWRLTDEYCIRREHGVQQRADRG